MRVDVTVTGLQQAKELLDGFSARRLNAAAATTLTRVARELGQGWQKQMADRFDRPTPGTLRSVKWTQARADSLVAEVKVQDQATGTPPVQWIAPEEQGGPRREKKFERALVAQGSLPAGWRVVPGPAAKLDSYGNMSRGQIVQVIAQLGVRYSPGYARVISPSAAKRAAKALATGRGYVAILPGNKAKLQPGVYERSQRALRPVMYFVRGAQYRKRLDLIGMASKLAPELLQREMQRAIEQSAARLAQRGAR